MKVLLFFLSLLIFSPVFSQKEEIVVFNPEKKYTQEFIDSIGNFQLGLDTKEYKKMLESDKSLLGWPKYYRAKAKSLYYKKEYYDSVIYYANKGIESYTNAKVKRPIDEEVLIEIYYRKGKTLLFLQDYENSIITLQKGLTLTKKYPYKRVAYILDGIASNHLHLGNNSTALNYYLEISKDSLDMSVPSSSVTTYNRIGVLYEALGDTKSAKHYYKKGLEVSHRANYKVMNAYLYGNLGEISRNEQKIDSTIYYYKKALEARKAKENVDTYSSPGFAVVQKSYIKIYEGSVQEAIDSLNTIVENIKSLETINMDDKSLMLLAIETLALAYEKQGNASHYSHLFNETVEFLNKFHEKQLEEDLANLEIRYQTKEKEASILQLEEKETQQATILKQQKTITYSLGGFLIVLLGLIVLFWRQRKLKTQYEKENLEQRLLRSQMNPHFVYNALNSICNLVEKKSNETIPYINKLANLFRLILTNSREELVSLNDEMVTIKNYLELQSNFYSSFDFSINVDDDINDEEVVIPPMLMQPFVENAIVHGFTNNDKRGKIIIDVSKQQKDNLILFKISDNGVGYSESVNVKAVKNHTSVSGDIVKERLTILKKKFKVNTRFIIRQPELGGTYVELYLPYLKD